MGYNKNALIVIGTLITLIFCSSAIHAEDHLLNDKKWALSFLIEEDFQLTSYEHYGVSISRRISDNSWIRLSECMMLDSYNYTDMEGYQIENWTTIVYLRYLKSSHRARFYWGGGPEIYYEYDEHKYKFTGYKNSKKSWLAGIVGILGVEVTATDYLRFHAEYRGSFHYKRSYYARYRPWEERLSFKIGEGVRFGLSIYF